MTDFDTRLASDWAGDYLSGLTEATFPNHRIGLASGSPRKTPEHTPEPIYDVRKFASISAAIAEAKADDQGGTVLLTGDSEGEVHVDEPIVLENGVKLHARGGHTRPHGTRLIGEHTEGPVVLVQDRNCGVSNVSVGASNDRRAADITDGHGIMIDLGDDEHDPFGRTLTRQILHDVVIENQPTDGLHVVGNCELSEFRMISVADCLRHGFVFETGDIVGYSNEQQTQFWPWLDACRASECGGQALIIDGTSNQAPIGFKISRFQALSCAWDTDQRWTGLEYQVVMFGHGMVVELMSVEDQHYDQTTTKWGGKSRDALASPVKGIQRNGQGTIMHAPFFSSLTESLNITGGAGHSILYPRINAGAYGVAQSVGIIIHDSTALPIEVLWTSSMTAGATQVVQNQTPGARLVGAGKPFIGDQATTLDIDDSLTPVAATIASAVLTSTARRIQVNGEGASADNMHTLRRASGYTGQAGEDVYLFRGAEDITVENSGGNIRTASGSDVVMTSSANQVVHLVYNGTVWQQV